MNKKKLQERDSIIKKLQENLIEAERKNNKNYVDNIKIEYYKNELTKLRETLRDVKASPEKKNCASRQQEFKPKKMTQKMFEGRFVVNSTKPVEVKKLI